MSELEDFKKQNAENLQNALNALRLEAGGCLTTQELVTIYPRYNPYNSVTAFLSITIQDAQFWPKWQFLPDVPDCVAFMRYIVNWDDESILQWLYTPNPFFQEYTSESILYEDGMPLLALLKTPLQEEERQLLENAARSWERDGGQGW